MKRRKTSRSASKVQSLGKRPALPKADAEMQRWCAVLEEEISTWPRVTSRPMFGLIGFYRDRKIFAALPRTRAADTPFSLLIKLPGAFDDDRLHRASGPGASWVTFAMESEGDIPDALGWLERGYEAVKARPSRPRRPR